LLEGHAKTKKKKRGNFVSEICAGNVQQSLEKEINEYETNKQKREQRERNEREREGLKSAKVRLSFTFIMLLPESAQASPHSSEDRARWADSTTTTGQGEPPLVVVPMTERKSGSGQAHRRTKAVWGLRPLPLLW